MTKLIFIIGRHRFYPYASLLLVTLAYLYTNPFNGIHWRYLASYFGAVMGLLCVILLAKGKNSGNTLGIFAVFGEGTGNFLGSNLGASLPSLYYFCTHVYGLVSWRRHRNPANQLVVRQLVESQFFILLLFFVFAALLNIYLTNALNIENDPYQLVINNFIFALGVSAQWLMIQRYTFNWYLWITLNILVISLNIYTDNPVIATQYSIYLFNAIYGLLEWRQSIHKQS